MYIGLKSVLEGGVNHLEGKNWVTKDSLNLCLEKIFPIVYLSPFVKIASNCI